MSKLESAQTFSLNQLNQLESCLHSDLLLWAASTEQIRESNDDGRLIRDMAAVHAKEKADLAQGRLLDFRFAQTLGYDLQIMRQEFGWKSPLEAAGNAAGQLAVAKLLTKWYDLTAEDFSRLAEMEKRDNPQGHKFFDRRLEHLEHAVGTVPCTLEIAPFDKQKVFVEEKFAAQGAVRRSGPAALEPFVAFAEYPIEIR
ncbi:MAG TPA: hypothetical protein VF733_00455 [Candidatus Saccharimonadales bacterium]